MSSKPVIADAKQAFEKAIAHLEKEFAGIHAGRASTSLVENIMVEAYGQVQPVKNLAQITVSEATQLIVQPWDQNLVSAVEKAIKEKSVGFGTQNDGRLIRVNIPPLTEERRREMTKLVSKTAENAKITIRNAREDARKNLKRLKEDGELSEDGLASANDELQKVVDEMNDQIAQKEKAKEDDILKI